MAYRKVLQWPDKNLQKKSEDVVHGDESILDLFRDMIDTLKIERGAGLAAPQIGINQNVVVIDLGEMASPSNITQKLTDELVDERYWLLLNPKLDTSRETQRWSEGCLSVPWVSAEVERHSVCTVNYLTSDFKTKTVSLSWPLSGAVQHECDHLDGNLFLDKLSRLKSSRLKKYILKKRKKIEDYKDDLLTDHEEKKIGKKKKSAHLRKKEIQKRKAVKKLNSRSRSS